MPASTSVVLRGDGVTAVLDITDGRLPGLHCSAPMTLDGTAHNMMLPLSGAELLSLEERDVRRDFPA